MKTERNKIDLDLVIKYFVKGYKLKKGEELYDWEYFIDPVRKKVIIELTIKQSSSGGEQE